MSSSTPFSISIPPGTDELTKSLIQQLTTAINQMNTNITTEIKTMRDQLTDDVKDAKRLSEANKVAIDELKLTMDQIKVSCVGLVEENIKLKKQCNYLDNYGRRNNLVVKGVKEDNGETNDICEALTKSFFKDNLKMSATYVDSLDIVRCHRLGGKRAGGNHRPIIVRFQRFRDRQTVWAERFNLARTTFSLHENFSNDTEYNRRKLYPILAAAKKQEKYKNNSYLNVDKLRICDNEYSVDNICDLPGDIHPRNLAHKSDRDKKFLVFGGIHSDHYFLSNFYKLPKDMVVDGVHFPTLEHAYQHQKALYFLDDLNAQKIRYAKEPKDAKFYGRSVVNFKAKEWDTQKKQIMLRLLRIKFESGSKLGTELLGTGSQTLAEAGSSRSFSIGLPLSSGDIYKKKSWTGDNLLGKCLQTIRTELKTH